MREIVRQFKNRRSRTAVLVHHDSDCHIYEQQHLRVKFERLLTLRKERHPFDGRSLPTCAGRPSDILSSQGDIPPWLPRLGAARYVISEAMVLTTS